MRDLLHCRAMARQHLGQHFLSDLYWREQIARAIHVSPHSDALAVPRFKSGEYCWIEIGPGNGELTEFLARTGAPVHAIELDESLAGALRHLSKKFPNLEVIAADILQTDLRAVSRGLRMRIYGSLPYYITSPILHHLFQFSELIDDIHVIVQTEVAERMAAPPGSKAYGYLSVATQLNARTELVQEIPRGAFNPPPEVDSTLVTLRLPGEWAKLRGDSPLDEEAFLDFVKACFSQKRKTLVNNLRGRCSPERVRAALAASGLRPDARAEQVSISGLAQLFRALEKPPA
ncbi:MAG TPA: 16S rRNA (adenine(1518)-N(6)/adenine(1519)-N(6))-dimethyltransferase RsmA [Candidatus Acidoferrum sp.]